MSLRIRREWKFEPRNSMRNCVQWEMINWTYLCCLCVRRYTPQNRIRCHERHNWQECDGFVTEISVFPNNLSLAVSYPSGIRSSPLHEYMRSQHLGLHNKHLIMMLKDVKCRTYSLSRHMSKYQFQSSMPNITAGENTSRGTFNDKLTWSPHILHQEQGLQLRAMKTGSRSHVRIHVKVYDKKKHIYLVHGLSEVQILNRNF